MGVKMIIRVLSAFTIFVVGISSVGYAETLHDALRMTYASNPQLQAERAGLRALDEKLVQARAARLPNVLADISAGATRQKQSSPFFSALQTYYPRSIALSGQQTLYGGGAIKGQIDLTQVNIEIGINNLRQLEHQVLLAAVTAYADVQRNAEVVRIRSSNVEVLLRQLDAAQDRFAVGEITRTGVSQAKARLAGARSQLAAARAELAIARSSYVRTVGQAPGSLQQIPDPDFLPDGLAMAIQWAEANSPVLLNARLSELAAAHGVSIAKAGLRPNLSIGAQARTADDAGFIGGESDLVAASVNLRIPLFTGGLNRSVVREAKEQASKARISVLQAKRVTDEQVSIAWNRLIAAKSVIAASELQVQANELAFDGVVLEAEVGSRTTLDVLDAEQELLDARLALVSAQRDALVASFGLLAATGRLELAELGIDTPKTNTKQEAFP